MQGWLMFCFVLFCFVLFCFVLFALQLSVCLCWPDYRRDDFPTLNFWVVMADLLVIRRERSPLH